MAGAFRRMGVYLGLVEGDPHDDEYDEQDDYVDDPRSRRAPLDTAPRRSHTGAVAPSRPEPRRESRSRYDDYETFEETEYIPAVRTGGGATVTALPGRQEAPAPLQRTLDTYRITTLHPRTYNEARQVGEAFRDGVPVIMNLTELDDGDAKRLIDFAAGLIFGLHGNIERVTNKVFLLTPANVRVTAEDRARLAAEGGFFNQS